MVQIGVYGLGGISRRVIQLKRSMGQKKLTIAMKRCYRMQI